MRSLKAAIASTSAVVLAFVLSSAVPIDAQQNRQDGVVNVAVFDVIDGDVLSNNTVNLAVAANIAANVCGVVVGVGVIADQVFRTGEFVCEGAEQGVSITQLRGRQR
jgi:hypothetical protein